MKIKYCLNEFFELNESELLAIFAESGEDREMDFNLELAVERLYESESESYNLKYFMTNEDKLNKVLSILQCGNWKDAVELYKKVNCSVNEFRSWLSDQYSVDIKDMAILGFYKD